MSDASALANVGSRQSLDNTTFDVKRDPASSEHKRATTTMKKATTTMKKTKSGSKEGKGETLPLS